MTEQMLQKLEEKIVALLSELETLRAEAKLLRNENVVYKKERTEYVQRVQDIMALLDGIQGSESILASNRDLFNEKTAREEVR